MYIKREIEEEIKPFLQRKEIIAIVGPRQVGKTTFLEHLSCQLKKEKISVAYLTFEQRSVLKLFEEIEDFKALYQNYQVVIIDEFQYAKNGGQKLKYLYDTTKVKYIISGSSSLELKFATGKYLVGRMIKFTLLPLSFREYLSFKNPSLHLLLKKRVPNLFTFHPQNKFGEEIAARLRNLFEEYLQYGSYPAVIQAKTAGEKNKLLESILENYLLKDIGGLLQLTTEEELLRLGRFLAAQVGNLVNYQELSRNCGLNYQQVLKHLQILKQTYIIDLPKPYFTNKRTELSKNPKVYFMDNGFKNYLLGDFRPPQQRRELGSLVENYVYFFLKRNFSSSPINFWRTKSGAEIDFVIQKESSLLPIEVKYSPQATLGKSFYSFINKFSPQKAYLLTKEEAKEVRINKTKVLFLPAYYL